MKRMSCSRQRKFCFRRCSTALPTVSRSLRRSSCSSARTVQSEETRLHLQDAHQRTSMSVATVQEQLHASGLNERIAIGPYLTMVVAVALQLRWSANEGSLDRRCKRPPAGRPPAKWSVWTDRLRKLVINALKHGFPACAGWNPGSATTLRESGRRLSVSRWIRPHGHAASLMSAWDEHSRGAAHQLNATVEKTERTQGHCGDNYCRSIIIGLAFVSLREPQTFLRHASCTLGG